MLIQLYEIESSGYGESVLYYPLFAGATHKGNNSSTASHTADTFLTEFGLPIKAMKFGIMCGTSTSSTTSSMKFSRSFEICSETGEKLYSYSTNTGFKDIKYETIDFSTLADVPVKISASASVKYENSAISVFTAVFASEIEVSDKYIVFNEPAVMRGLYTQYREITCDKDCMIDSAFLMAYIQQPGPSSGTYSEAGYTYETNRANDVIDIKLFKNDELIDYSSPFSVKTGDKLKLKLIPTKDVVFHYFALVPVDTFTGFKNFALTETIIDAMPGDENLALTETIQANDLSNLSMTENVALIGANGFTLTENVVYGGSAPLKIEEDIRRVPQTTIDFSVQYPPGIDMSHFYRYDGFRYDSIAQYASASPLSGGIRNGYIPFTAKKGDKIYFDAKVINGGHRGVLHAWVTKSTDVGISTTEGKVGSTGNPNNKTFEYEITRDGTWNLLFKFYQHSQIDDSVCILDNILLPCEELPIHHDLFALKENVTRNDGLEESDEIIIKDFVEADGFVELELTECIKGTDNALIDIKEAVYGGFSAPLLIKDKICIPGGAYLPLSELIYSNGYNNIPTKENVLQRHLRALQLIEEIISESSALSLTEVITLGGTKALDLKEYVESLNDSQLLEISECIAILANLNLSLKEDIQIIKQSGADSIYLTERVRYPYLNLIEMIINDDYKTRLLSSNKSIMLTNRKGQ